MNSIVWWSTITLVTLATATDVRTGRIPNRLVYPFLLAGMAVSVLRHGAEGLWESLGGVFVAMLALGAFVWLGGLGMGDLKLCAAVGAWIGPSQMLVALIAISIAGGAFALIWATRQRVALDAFENAGTLMAGFFGGRRGAHPRLALGKPGTRGFPYAPAIAAGTIFSFFAS